VFVRPPTLFLLHLLLAYFSFLFSRAPLCTVYLEGYIFGGLSIWRAIYNWRDPSSFLPPSLFLPPCSFLSFSEDSIISLTLTLKPLGINHVHRPTHAPTGPRVRRLRGCHFISRRRAVAACWSESSCSPRHCTMMGWESRRASVGCLRVCTRVSFFGVCRCTPLA